MENMKRVVSLMLCIVMVFGLLPMTVFATDMDITDEGKTPNAYVRVDKPTYGKNYIIVNASGAGERNALTAKSANGYLDGSGTPVTVNAGTADYILASSVEAGKGVIWTAKDNLAGQMNFKSDNGENLCGMGIRLQLSTDSATAWDVDTNCMYDKSSLFTSYLCYNEQWCGSLNEASVYFYEAQVIDLSAESPEEELNESITITTQEEKTKTDYVLQSGNPTGTVLITNGATEDSTNVLLNNNNTAGNVSTAVKSGDIDGDGENETYIELSDADAAKALWTVGGSYTFQNNRAYLRRSNGSLRIETNSTNCTWSYDTSNRLTNGRYYLRYSESWSLTNQSNNASAIYFYAPQEVAYTESVEKTYTVSVANLTIVMDENATAQIEATLTENDENITGLTYTVRNGDVTVSDSGVITAGAAGAAQVLVSYTTTDGKTIGKVVDVTVVEPTYKVEITREDAVVSGSTISVKGVEAGKTMTLAAQVYVVAGETATEADLPGNMSIVWEMPAEYNEIATVSDGVVTFTGKDGVFYVTAKLMKGDKIVDSKEVSISATTTSYSVPADGTTDFPEYPNEGAIRYDKTASAVGNFAETGIAKMELSMTGVPYHTGNTLDVVIMLDRSSSMYKSGVQHRIQDTIDATKLFIESIVKNTDGSFNGNRIMVMDFLGGNLDSSQGGGSSHKYQSNLYTSKESNGYQVIDNQAEMEALFTKIQNGFKGQTSLYGTEYAQGLEDCYNALRDSRADGNQQFCVFMSDGIPNYMQGEKTHFKKTSDIVGMFTVTNSNAANASVTRNSTKYEYEYYSTEMKKEGVTVFTVGLGLKGTNSAWSGASKEACEQVANMLLNDIAGPAYEKTTDRDTGKAVSKMNSYFFSVADENASEGMKNAFADIAQKILQAATDVTVEDEITKDYTMIFDVPAGSTDISDAVAGQKFYIEFLKYTLDADHERTGTPTSLSKMYLKNSGNQYSAVNENGTAYASPVFEQKTLGDKGTLYYWTTDASKGDTGVSYTTGGKTYYFVSYGLKAGANNYNMTSGGFASGSVNTENNMSQNLVLATPYFVYNAATKMLYWTVDKLDSYEYVLNYFLYLNNSATEVVNSADTKEIPAGSYPTNDHAYITYTNFNGNGCRQEFPKPQMTWNGAQASYEKTNIY